MFLHTKKKRSYKGKHSEKVEIALKGHKTTRKIKEKKIKKVKWSKITNVITHKG